MIGKFILHIEWHRGYNHNLPRISIKRAPYPGKLEHVKGEGYYKLVMCQPCSGVGYLYGPLSEIERRDLSNGPTLTTEEMLASVKRKGPVWTEETYWEMAVEDGLISEEEYNRRVIEALDRDDVTRGDSDEIVGRYLRPTSDPDVFEDELVFASDLEDPALALRSTLAAETEPGGSVYDYMPAPALQDRWGRYPDNPHYGQAHHPRHDGREWRAAYQDVVRQNRRSKEVDNTD